MRSKSSCGSARSQRVALGGERVKPPEESDLYSCVLRNQVNEEGHVLRRLGLIASLAAAALVLTASAAGSSPTFTITPLLRPDGSLENAISIGASGLMALTALSGEPVATDTWLGQFGTTPSFVGQFDANLGSRVGGGGDADVDLGSTGTLHLTSLIF